MSDPIKAAIEQAGDSTDVNQTLSAIPFLSGASARGLARLSKATQLVEFKEGDTIFKEGDPPTQLFVVKEGRIQITKTYEDGVTEEKRMLGTGDMLGELGILGGAPRTATAIVTETSSLWSIEREAFLELYSSEPTVSIEVASWLARYLLDDDGVAEDLLFLNLEGRVAKRLLSWVGLDGKNVYHAVASGKMDKEQVIDVLRQLGQSRSEDETVTQLYSDIEGLSMATGGTKDQVSKIVIDFEAAGFLVNTEGNIILIDSEPMVAIAGL
jgi:CRP/FNR family transcriptional regulator/CRP/FNR family cyclic AMP-dependent transcriptional regulator